MDREDQRFLSKLMQKLALGKRVAASQRRQEKAEAERQRAELELLMDDLAAEGVDCRTPLGKQVLLAVLQARVNRNRRARAVPWCDQDGFPTDRGDL